MAGCPPRRKATMRIGGVVVGAAAVDDVVVVDVVGAVGVADVVDAVVVGVVGGVIVDGDVVAVFAVQFLSDHLWWWGNRSHVSVRSLKLKLRLPMGRERQCQHRC